MLNVDGAAKGDPGKAGGGGVFRDAAGEFLLAFSFSCGICTPLMEEVWAAYHGLRMARRIGCPRLVL